MTKEGTRIFSSGSGIVIRNVPSTCIAGALSLRERVARRLLSCRKGESTMPVFSKLRTSSFLRHSMVLPVEIPPVIRRQQTFAGTQTSLSVRQTHSCLFPDSRLKARCAHTLRAYVPLTLPNATRVFYVVQDWPFALSAGARPRICFLARRSGERAAQRLSRRLESVRRNSASHVSKATLLLGIMQSFVFTVWS